MAFRHHQKIAINLKYLPFYFLLVDIGFILYWVITALHIIPPEWAYKDYSNPLLVSWNWSFMPIDIAVSMTGLLSLSMQKRKDYRWLSVSLISLILTSASGLMAISFWTMQSDFDITWWLPNLFLLVYPWMFIPQIIGSRNVEV